MTAPSSNSNRAANRAADRAANRAADRAANRSDRPTAELLEADVLADFPAALGTADVERGPR